MPATIAGAFAARRRPRPESAEPARAQPFQRDRDRIIHSNAFRRLNHKTQVFIFHEGDHFRTRLTHTLEVAQIARSVAAPLAPRRGSGRGDRAGPRSRPSAVRSRRRARARQGDAAFGGFDHNAQSLRVVTALERKYAAVRRAQPHLGDARGPGQAQRAGDGPTTLRSSRSPRRIERWQSLDLASLAVGRGAGRGARRRHRLRHHDIDDGLRAHLIGLSDLQDQPLAGPAMARVRRQASGDEARAVHELTRRLITQMIADLVTETRTRLAALHPHTPDDIRRRAAGDGRLLSRDGWRHCRLKAFLFERVYRHERVMGVMRDAERIVGDLFARYMAEPHAMRGSLERRIARPGATPARAPHRRLRRRHDRSLCHRRAPSAV